MSQTLGSFCAITFTTILVDGCINHELISVISYFCSVAKALLTVTVRAANEAADALHN